MVVNIAFIFARGDSKGLPGKNIRSLAGKPLIAYSIEQALMIGRIDRVLVSTDSEEIAEVAKKYGAEVPFLRPLDLALDDTPEWLAWRHALKYMQETENEKVDSLVVIPPTAPLRSTQDIENCLDEFGKGDVDVVITVSDAHRSPYFNMVKCDDGGYTSLVIPPNQMISRRQDTPEVFDMTTVAYVARPDFVMQCDGIFDGRVRSVYIPPERALDIDTALDFKIAEILVDENRANLQ